jgi:protein phosphatase PTC2/3
MSRGLGNFRFKVNKDLPAEEQAYTADPEITCHDISEEDEFLVLASDGSLLPYHFFILAGAHFPST